jgi:hypothetical protein
VIDIGGIKPIDQNHPLQMMVVHALSTVVKTEMMRPFCVKHHVDIRLDAS